MRQPTAPAQGHRWLRDFLRLFSFAALLTATVCLGRAGVYNLKVVTDASPDYSDLASLIRSATSRWQTPAEKCWALFYWNHIARRQTAPMIVHGLALTDPIRQFNDYGYTMCSTISGINCAIWDAMGLPVKYWDISLHTVPEVGYGNAWHMYDNSMSALYTRCDGSTIASVEEIGEEGACAASAGKRERGHIAKYHCLNATSPNGFLTGADTSRALDEESRCFNPKGLKFRSYFHDWDRGHRYILNLRQNEAYTRSYAALGSTPEYYVANQGKDPELANPRYHLRGNGVWQFKPDLDPGAIENQAYQLSGARSIAAHGVEPSRAGAPAEIIFKIQGANVITSLGIAARFVRRDSSDVAGIFVSASNGLDWIPVWTAHETGSVPVHLRLRDEVNGSYEILVKVTLLAPAIPADAQLQSIEFNTTTMLNSKAQPKLLLGKNTIDVGAGDLTDSIVFWPDLQGTHYQQFRVEEKNIETRAKHPGYMGVLHAARPKEEAYVVFRMDAPRDITQIQYGGRFYNRAAKSHIDLSHSFDGGRRWTKTYSLTNTAQPWDVLHYETSREIPPRTRSVLFKYSINSSTAGPDACSLYAVRMEVNHQPADPGFKPLAVTFDWSERQHDYSLVERSHTEWITQLPHRYTIDVGGADHPVMRSLRIESPGDAHTLVQTGYSDGHDPGGEKFVSRWRIVGRNFALGKPYTVSVPSTTQWDSGDPNNAKLTDGVVGPPYPGGTSPSFALGWNKGTNPDITVDLGGNQPCGAFRIELGAGWPWWDALKGEIKDSVEVLTSTDGQNFASHGFFNLNLRWKDIPANHLWPDDEIIGAHNFELLLDKPVPARYVRYRITPQRSLTVSEVQVFDRITYQPFDLRVALPGE